MSWQVSRTPEFDAWLRALRDIRGKAVIARRIDRLASGHRGDAKAVGGGVQELRIDHGPGYRVYFVRRGDRWVVLLCGGDKGSQRGDIDRALKLAEEV